MKNILRTNKIRYEGKRLSILYGCYKGIEKFAINELQRTLQTYVPYVLPVLPANTVSFSDNEDNILVGTPENNPLIGRLCSDGAITIPDDNEGYTVACLPLPSDGGNLSRTIVLAGRSSAGVLYAVMDFNTRTLGCEAVRDDPKKDSDVIDKINTGCFSTHPRIANRGIWTWGYVIYDYRGFLDNMARLRMNMLTIWNDIPPVNIADIIEYAHNRGIKIILGFHWGWGYDFDLSDINHVQEIQDHILQEYNQNYACFNHDGIYFQTNTETDKTMVNGIPRAKLVCEFVNKVAGVMLKEHPGLKIQFGLHATSILGDYIYFKDLDKRVTIVWEDAGVIPYSYDPEYSAQSPSHAAGLGSIESTIAYSRNIARLREGSDFALVPKGFINIRWDTEFEHHGSFVLGERSKTYIRRRLAERKSLLAKADCIWLKHYKMASRFFREIIQSGQDHITATALVEDGMFEAAIPFSVALFSQILWDPFADEEEMAAIAMSAYYRDCL